MRKHWLYILFVLVIGTISAEAEVVILRSGQSVVGEVLLNNDEVVIVRKKDGTRYQYPKTEVVSIQEEGQTNAILTDSTQSLPNTQKVALRIMATGGAAYIPAWGWGGNVQADIMLGAHNVMDKSIFIGGAIGYHSVFVPEQSYGWIPLQLVMQSPIMWEKNKDCYPTVGVNIGYAFAANKQWKGGLCTGVSIGGVYAISDNSHLLFALRAQWQQTRIQIVENIHGIDYNNVVGNSILTLGASIGLQF